MTTPQCDLCGHIEGGSEAVVARELAEAEETSELASFGVGRKGGMGKAGKGKMGGRDGSSKQQEKETKSSNEKPCSEKAEDQQ